MTTGIFPGSSTGRPPRRPLPADCHARRSAALRAGLLTLASVIAMAALSTYARAATVATDQPDYHPGQTVTITGGGWEPGETVDMVLHEDPPLDPDLELTSVADANGDFANTDFTVDVFDIGVTFTLTATGLSSGQTAETTFTDGPGTCGNGTVETGEDCDLGSALNGAAGSCCKNNCNFASSTNTCRAAAGECDLPETCTGSSATCPADGPRKASGTACTDDGNACTLDQCNGTSTSCQHPAGNGGAVCRAAAGECDLPETCTGSSTTCPADGTRKASGRACTDDGNPCTLDQCDGTSTSCQHPAGNAATVCRAGAGECDVAETCTGSSTTCPTDAKKASGTACTADTNPCTLDQCDGTSNSCQHPAGNAGALCRAAVDECDATENCSGTSTTCPSDVKQPAGTACTDDGNPCTADTCNGTSNSCQHPAGNAGADCAADGDPCTEDTCDGTSTSCQHLPGNPGAVCRPAAGECDVAETCPGAYIIGYRGSATNSSGTASCASSLSINRP